MEKIFECLDSVKIVDVSSKLPGLKYSRGFTYWLPASKDIQVYEKFDEVPEKWRTVVRPEMFPPQPSEAAQYGLDNW